MLSEDKRAEKSTKNSEIEESLCYHRYWAGVSFSTISTHLIRGFWLQMHLNKIRSCKKKKEKETELFHTSSLSHSLCFIKSVEFSSKQRKSRFLEFIGLWDFKSVHSFPPPLSSRFLYKILMRWVAFLDLQACLSDFSIWVHTIKNIFPRRSVRKIWEKSIWWQQSLLRKGEETKCLKIQFQKAYKCILVMHLLTLGRSSILHIKW